jgi:hypothetical protein
LSVRDGQSLEMAWHASLTEVPIESRGVADDGIPIAIENRYFAVMRENALAAFMVEHNNVVGVVLFVVDDYLRASFAEGLDDLRGLRSGAAARMAGKGIARTTAVSFARIGCR